MIIFWCILKFTDVFLSASSSWYRIYSVICSGGYFSASANNGIRLFEISVIVIRIKVHKIVCGVSISVLFDKVTTKFRVQSSVLFLISSDFELNKS